MKVSRIYPHFKTKGEIAHDNLVIRAKRKGFKHPGSKPHSVLKQDTRSGRSSYVNAQVAALKNIMR